MSKSAFLRGVSACALVTSCAFFSHRAAAQEELPTIEVAGEGSTGARTTQGPRTAAQIWSANLPNGESAMEHKYNVPNASGSHMTRADIDNRVNIVTSQDAVKYLPSLYVSENRGATQGRLQTRSFESSERNIVYLDNIPLNSLVGRGGAGGFYGGLQTQFRVVAPEEIERVDFMSGPFSAQYDGRSMGGVLTYTSKMPDKFQFTAKETVSIVDYDWSGLKRAFPRSVTELTVGDRWDNFSWFLTAAYQTYQYAPTAAAAIPSLNAPLTYGEYLTWNRTGFPSRVAGVGGMMDVDLTNTKLKLAYDFTPTLRLSHSVGVYTQDRNMYSETFFSNNSNRWYTWFGPSLPGLANGYGAYSSYYGRHQDNMLVNALSLRQNTGGVFDFDMTASHFYFMHNVWNQPLTNVGNTGGFTSTGLSRKETGDYWATLDLKGILRPFGKGGAHEISFGLYGDQAHVVAPTYQSLSWPSGQASNVGNFYTSIAKGTTRTQALWIQEAWRFHPGFKATVGVRGEHWIASDGFNQSATAAASGGILRAVQAPVFQPRLAHTRFSPKGSLEWKPDEDWTITASVGMANRFPVVSELYALSTPSGFSQPVNPNPNLRPEVSLNKELTIRRDLRSGGSVRVTLFHDDIRDFMASQLVAVPGALAPGSATTNIELVRNTGVEVDLRKSDFLLEGLTVFANAVFLNSHVIANGDYIPAPAACGVGSANTNSGQNCWLLTDVGKRVPSAPKWRWKAGLSWNPDDRWSFSTNLRWIDYAWQTTANNDVSCCNLGAGFGSGARLFTVDFKASYKWNDRFTFYFGVDNIGNYASTMMAQRTFFGALRYKFEEGQKGGNGIFFAGDEAGLPDVSRWVRLSALRFD